MKKSIILILSIIIFNTAVSATAAPKYFSDKTKVTPSHIYDNTILIPKGSVLTIIIKDAINKDSVNKADKVSAILKNDFIYNGKVIAPEGSTVEGNIININKQNNIVNVNVLYTNIITVNGINIPITALAVSEDESGYINIDNYNNNNIEIITKQPVTYIQR